MSSPFYLLGKKRFLPFFITQFLGAFNDNLYKNALIVMLTFNATRYTTMDTGTLVSLCAGIFILPFFLFSATCGQLADKYEKSRLTQLTKLLEIGIMLIVCLGFYLNSLAWLIAALFLLGTQSTIFGPVKYAILPQSLNDDELVSGNALIESGTFIAILMGTLAGGLLIAVPNGTLAFAANMMSDGALLVAITGLCVAIAGYISSRSVPKTPVADPDLVINWNPVTETYRNIRYLSTNKAVFLSILGISWAWFYGAVFLSQLPVFVKEILHGDEMTISLLLTVFSIGIGVGSFLCERLSGKYVEIGLVPMSAIGLTLFAFDMWLNNRFGHGNTQQSFSLLIGQFYFWRNVVDLLCIGIFGGLFMVPLYTMMQTRSDTAVRSRVIAGNNILNALFMVIAALMCAAMLSFGYSVVDIFLLLAALNMVVCIYIFTVLPEFVSRFLVLLFVKLFYRLNIKGLKNIPETGPALIVCNHVSFIDPLIIIAASRRPVRFVMDYNIYKQPLIHFIFKQNKAIPIATASEDVNVMQKAYDDIAQALKEGDLVGIFPEGSITRSGEINIFKGGVSKILAKVPVPVIPMALRGLWGSFFSRKQGKAMSKPFCRGICNKIELVIDEPILPENVTPRVLKEKVMALRGDWQ